MSIEDIEIHYFDNDIWKRDGIYIDGLKTIFVNSSLSPEAQKRVILHELGHVGQMHQDYQITRIKCENEANRAMIHSLLEEELKQSDIHDFNYIDFMKRHKLKTMTDECMVKDELLSLIS